MFSTKMLFLKYFLFLLLKIKSHTRQKVHVLASYTFCIVLYRGGFIDNNMYIIIWYYYLLPV